ncbi:MAG: tetratricopeptide repeat protein [bacterium]|nr:tetratricopeptide repeat protein [bacterium]
MKKLYWIAVLAIVSLVFTGCFNYKYVKVTRTMMKAQQEVEKEEYDRAIERLSKLKEDYPEFGRWPDLMLADAYQKKGDYAKAEAILKGIERDEGLSFEAYLKKGGLYLAQNKEAEAERVFETVREKGAIQTEEAIARIYEEQKQYEEALAIYTRLKEEHPDHFLAHTDLGNVYRKMGQAVKAIGSYQEALNLNPKNVEALLWLGGLYFITGQEEKTRATVTKVPAIPEGKEYTRLVKTMLKYLDSSSYKKSRSSDVAREELSAGKLNEAAEIYQKTLLAIPADSRLHFNLGAIYLLKGMDKEAVREFKKVKDGDEAGFAKVIVKEVLDR